MTILFIEYPKCSTCQKARKWLTNHDIHFDNRHIVEQNPSATELGHWIRLSQLPIQKFFNTSGLLYKSMDLKNKLPTMSENQCTNILASNGMLIKRPIIIGETFILIGFKETEWENKLLNSIK